MRLRDSPPACRRLRRAPCAFFASAKSSSPPSSKNGCLRRQLAGLLVGGGELARLVLAGLDIGLIERIDAEDRAGDRGGDLPAEEFLADVIAIGDGDAHDRMPARSSAATASSCFGIRFARQPQIDEQAIRAVDVGRAQRLGVDRDEALALLAGRFGEELLEPGAEIGDAGRGDDRDLVAARLCRARPGSSPSTTPGFSAGGTLAAQERTIICGALEQRCRRRGPSPRPAPCRNPTAPNSARRCSACRTRCGGTDRVRRSSAASSRDR